MPVTVTPRTRWNIAPVSGSSFLARTHTPVTPKLLLHSVRGRCRGGRSTVPCSELPAPRSVIRFLRIITAWRYTPFLSTIVVPGWARLTARWMDWLGPTTMTDPACAAAGGPDSDADAATAENMDMPMTAVLAHAAMKNLRTKSPLARNSRWSPLDRRITRDIIGAPARWQDYGYRDVSRTMETKNSSMDL